MSRVNDRSARPTQPFDSRKLAKLAEQPAPAKTERDERTADGDHLEAVAEWNELASSTGRRIATGSTPPLGVPVEESARLRARTATVHDPLTTSLLAEVARHDADEKK